MARSRVLRPSMRLGVAALAAVGLAAGFLGSPAHSRGAASATQSSVNVAVVPGFNAPIYPGFAGVGKFPSTNSQLSAYHFTELPTSKLTASGLAPYDTVILYGIRWNTISAGGQAALNTFAATHKVMIWDADGTGAQNYSTFIQPFSTLASNASGMPKNSTRHVPDVRERLRQLPRELQPEQPVLPRSVPVGQRPEHDQRHERDEALRARPAIGSLLSSPKTRTFQVPLGRSPGHTA